MNWLQASIDAAQSLNPRIKVQDRGDWQGLGRLFNVVLADGQQTSIVVKPGEDVAAKIVETVGKFERP